MFMVADWLLENEFFTLVILADLEAPLSTWN